MPLITSITVRAEVPDAPHAGTDDRMYVVLHGDGGMELSLNTEKDDFERDGLVRIFLGEPQGNMNGWEPAQHSEPGGNADPRRYGTELTSIQSVSLRKGGTWEKNQDDRLELAAAEVRLYGDDSSPAGPQRLFGLSLNHRGSVFLGNEIGREVYLVELIEAIDSIDPGAAEVY